MTIINVKAKENNAVGVGYSFEINTPEKPLKDTFYLPENRMKDNYYQDYQTGIERGMMIGGIGIMSQYLATSFLGMHKLGAMATVGAATTTIRHIDLMTKLMPIVHLIQDIALPISIIVACWSCIEWIIGSPGWKQKIKGAIVGFCGIYLIPFVFEAVGGALSGL